jgi:photosystem II stability/assembly factor-like uncharacterized protein
VNTVLGSHGRDRGYGQLSSLVVDSRDPQAVYATVVCAGIFKSGDGGRTWRSANAGRVPGCLDSSLALDPVVPETVYAAYPGRGVFRSTDGGVHWQAAITGLDLTTVSSLAVDPGDPGRVYAGAGDQGLFVSADGGSHWRPVGHGFLRVVAVALDPRNPGVVLAAGPTRRMIRSADGGRTWHPAGAGLAANATVLAMSDGRAYAGTSARGVFTSTDGGRTWGGLPTPGKQFVEALAISPDDPGVVYAGLAGSSARGLFRSSDGGRTWQRLSAPLGDTDVFAVAVDPEAPSTLYLGSGDEGIFRSTDGGATWEPASSGLPRIAVQATTAAGEVTRVTTTVGITALAIDPASPSTLYAVTGGSGIFRSTDAGRTWHAPNAGLSVLDVRSLGIAATGRRLYAGTAQGGVVTLDLDPK